MPPNDKTRELKQQLENKVLRLEELIKARSKAFCTTVHSSGAAMKREAEIDELEEDIKKLEEAIKKAQ